jgi:hypothetical protein
MSMPPNPANVTQPIAIRGDISLSLHPDSIQPFKPILSPDQGSSAATAPAYGAATAALTTLYESMGQLEDAERTTRAAYPAGQVIDGAFVRLGIQPEAAQRLAADMGTKFASVARTFDAQYAQVQSAAAHLDERINAALQPAQRDNMAASAASDIRNYVRSLPDEKRVGFLHDAIESGDHEIMSAVLSTTPWVSGLNREQFADVKEWAREKFSPVEYAQLGALNKLAAHLESSSHIFVTRYKALLPTVRENPAIEATKKLKAS